jgi:uncharacterized membrane protein YoaK (UPF0700 family)
MDDKDALFVIQLSMIVVAICGILAIAWHTGPIVWFLNFLNV